MGAALARFAYSTLLRLATPAYLLRLLWRSLREPLYRHRLGERLGFGPADAVPGRVWIHAVSLGETRAAAPLVNALRRRDPAVRLLLTHGTATGREAGRALLREGDAQCWLPYDTPGAARRFLRRRRPAIGVLMETEVWPALLHAARREGVPMVLANARLSERSLAKGQRLGALMREAVGAIGPVLAQTEDDARRLSSAGAREVAVAGNLKYDMTPDPAQIAAGRAWRGALRRPVVLAASTREGEEGPLLDAWRTRPVPRPLLLLVPRHPQRFDEVASLVQARGFKLVRRSAATALPTPARDVDVLLGDSLGEMALYYAMAQVALLGGSFAPLGGQNLIEAAACGCPLIMGPHTFNFAEAAELSLAAEAALREPDLARAVERACGLAEAAPDRLAQMAAAATRFAAAHRGAADRMAAVILAQRRG